MEFELSALFRILCPFFHFVIDQLKGKQRKISSTFDNLVPYFVSVLICGRNGIVTKTIC